MGLTINTLKEMEFQSEEGLIVEVQEKKYYRSEEVLNFLVPMAQALIRVEMM